MFEALFLAANLTIHICPPPVVLGTEPWCQRANLSHQQTFFATVTLCKKTMRQGIRDGSGPRIARDWNLVPGTTLRVQCPPSGFIYEFTVK